MRIRELTIENFRRFQTPFTLNGFADGLNIICEPNETGKSTVLDALRSVLFTRYRSSAAELFRPYGERTAPTVSLTFEVLGNEWTLKKRFLQSPSVSLEGAGERFTSDDAEARLQQLLGFDPGRSSSSADESGALGLLWVEQAAAFAPERPGLRARRTIEGLLAAEIGAVTGGRRAEAVRGAVEAALLEFFTKTGAPRARLAAAHAALVEAKGRVAEARTQVDQLETVHTAIERDSAELRRVREELADPDLDASIDKARAAKARALNASSALDAAKARAAQAEAVRTQALEAQTRRVSDRQAAADAERALEGAKAAELGFASTLERARAQEALASTRLAAARKAADVTEGVRSEAATVLASARSREAIRAAFGRLDDANLLFDRIAHVEDALSKEPVTAQALNGLQVAERNVAAARAAFEAGSGSVSVKLTEEGKGRVTIDGAPFSIGELRIIDPVTIVIEGVGSLLVSPAASSGAVAAAKLTATVADRDRLLKSVGQVDLAMADVAARRRQTLEQDIKSLSAQLILACPSDKSLGIEAGRDALVVHLEAKARPAAAPPLHELQDSADAAQRSAAEAQLAERRLTQEHGVALKKRTDGESEHARLAAATSQAQETLSAATALVRRSVEARSDVGIEQAVRDANEATATANGILVGASREAEDLDDVDKRVVAAVRRKSALEQAHGDIRERIAVATGRAHELGGQGPSTELGAALEAAELAEGDVARLTFEGESLKLLKTVLDAASSEASRRYLEPVTRRIDPYVRRLLPDARLGFDETFGPQTLDRGGLSEAVANLSKGTQEQLAVLTRLGFAELLAERGSPASLILDDSLVFSDDDRLETMVQILSDAAKKMQIIVLTCRGRAFRAVDAHRLSLRPA
jgi:hypothetical protein